MGKNDFSSNSTILSTNAEEESKLESLSKSYNDLLFLSQYSSFLSEDKSAVIQSNDTDKDNKDNFSTVEKGKLNLSHKKISSLDFNRESSINKLSEITSLDISNNLFIRISSITVLYRLKELDISYNKLTKLVGIDSLISLIKLRVSNNYIESIEGTESLKNLEEVDLTNNRIKSIKSLEPFFRRGI